MRVAAEQGVMIGERGRHFVVAGKRLAFRQHELARRLALGERPIADAMLDDQARGDLRDAQAVLGVALGRALLNVTRHLEKGTSLFRASLTSP